VVEEIEYCSEVYIKAKSVGEPIVLPDEEMARMDIEFQAYGQKVDLSEEK
jgi:L-fuculose-phosphate aldolase